MGRIWRTFQETFSEERTLASYMRWGIPRSCRQLLGLCVEGQLERQLVVWHLAHMVGIKYYCSILLLSNKKQIVWKDAWGCCQPLTARHR